MELRVNEFQELQPIDFNYIELKENLKEKLEVYKNAVYTEETIKEAKEDRAKLNKLSKAINDKKIEIKKEVLKPFEDFENKAKELMAMIEEATQGIDRQIKQFEDNIRDKKLQEIVLFFENNAEELRDVLNFDTIYNPKWLNATYKMPDIEKEIKNQINRTKCDLKVIEDLKSEFELQLKDHYLKTLNLSSTLAEKTRLEEQKKKIEEMKKKEVEEPKVVDNTTKEQSSFEIQKNELQQIDFRVWVTQEQKFSLREFLIKNNIKYGKVI